MQGVKSECGSPEQPGYSEVPLAASGAHDSEGEGEKIKSLTKGQRVAAVRLEGSVAQ